LIRKLMQLEGRGNGRSETGGSEKPTVTGKNKGKRGYKTCCSSSGKMEYTTPHLPNEGSPNRGRG